MAVSGYRLVYFQASFFNLIAMVAPPSVSGSLRPTIRHADHYALLEDVFLVLVVVGLLAMVRRTYRPLAGLAVAVLGSLALTLPLFRFVIQREMGAEVVLESVFFFGVLCLGLRRMLVGAMTRSYWTRLGTLLASFTLPLAVLLLSRFPFWQPWNLLLVSAGPIASLLVSLRPLCPESSEPLPIGWKSTAWGIATTVLLAAGVPPGARALNRALQRARLAKNRAAMVSIPEIPPDLPYPRLFFQRGVNFTAEFPAIYDSEDARQMLQILPQYGVNAVPLVPYGGSSRNKPVVRINAGENSWENDEGLQEPREWPTLAASKFC